MTGSRFAVVKIGGSILSDEDAYARVARLIAQQLGRAPTWFVVSAARGVTDELERLACATDERDPRLLLRRQREASGVDPDRAIEVELRRGLWESRAGRMDRLLAWGEQASAGALRAHLARLGVDVPIVELAPETPVASAPAALVPGFYLREQGGRVRCLPRGGSDISAVLVAIRLDAPSVRFWKDEGGYRAEGEVLAAVEASSLLDKLSGTVRPLHPEALALASRWGIDLVLEDPFGGHAATRIVTHAGLAHPRLGRDAADPGWAGDRALSLKLGDPP